MIESKVYRCELCGTTYSEKKSCEMCEAFHIRVPNAAKQHIINARYLAMNNSKNPFPDRIVVQFEHGRRASYEYRRSNLLEKR